jgi:hypothetical protein
VAQGSVRTTASERGGADLATAVIGSPTIARAARVFTAGLAGLLAGCLIAIIVIRTRRRSAARTDGGS